MECIDIFEGVTDFFKLYLSERKFHLSLENILSDIGTNISGVPRGVPRG